jgi:hypothetical protein
MRTASEQTTGVRAKETQKEVMTRKSYITIATMVPVTLGSARREELLKKNVVWE